MVKDNLEIRKNHTMDFVIDYSKAKLSYCPICNNLMQIISPMFSTSYTEEESGRNRKICRDCYNRKYGFFSHKYKTNGKKENIDNVENMKIEISRFLKKFRMKCYIDLTSLKNSGRSTLFCGENEVSFECNFNYHNPPTFEQFTEMMTIYSKRARLKDKKELLINKKFIQYLYECIVYSFSIGIDKNFITLINGL